MSSPGNSTINAKHRYFSTRKIHKTAQKQHSPEHTVVGQHQPAHCLQEQHPRVSRFAWPCHRRSSSPSQGKEMQKTSFLQDCRELYH